MMNKVLISENSRYVLCDLDSLYDLSSAIHQAACFINERTKFALQSNDAHVFINLDKEQQSLGLPVIGLPNHGAFEGQEVFYLEDYDQIKVFRTNLIGVDFFNDGGDVLFESIEAKAESIFESEGARPQVVRLILRNWPDYLKNLGENHLEVDFFLD